MKYCGLISAKASINSVNVILSNTKETENNKNNISNLKFNNDDIKIFDSEFESEVYNELKSKLNSERYIIDTQVKTGVYRIDIAIYDKLKKEFVLAIECDGDYYDSSNEQIAKDYERQTFLENCGWSFVRIYYLQCKCKNSFYKNEFFGNIFKKINN